MVRTKDAQNKKYHWRFKKVDGEGECEKITMRDFRTLREIATFNGISLAAVKNFTSTKRKCNLGKDKTRERWNNISIEKLF
tara:strand:- start:3827 stop:4069 length:243 start_codon:yes stop_codon:yes gene_type:complete